jgi:hypothetical protein
VLSPRRGESKCAVRRWNLKSPRESVFVNMLTVGFVRLIPLLTPHFMYKLPIVFSSTFLWFSRKPLGLQETSIGRAMCFFLLWNQCSKSTALRQVHSELRCNWPICLSKWSMSAACDKTGQYQTEWWPFSGCRVVTDQLGKFNGYSWTRQKTRRSQTGIRRASCVYVQRMAKEREFLFVPFVYWRHLILL